MSLFVKDKDFYSRFWRLTITIALQNVVVYAVNLADNVMLGRYTQDALSGVALCNQIFFIIQMMVTGIGEGLLVFAARSWGERDIPAVWRITNIAMKLAAGASLVCAAVVYLFPAQTLGLLSNDAAVIAEGVKYLRIIVFTYPLFAVTNVLLSMLRSVEVVRIGLVINCSALVVNVLLNYLLIFGHGGFPRLGTAGAAIATLAARLAELAIALVYVFAIDKRVRLRLRAFGRIDRALLRAYLRVGSPVLFSSIQWGIAMTIQTAILGHMSSDVIAASSIAGSVHSILTVVAYGSASASGQGEGLRQDAANPVPVHRRRDGAAAVPEPQLRRRAVHGDACGGGVFHDLPERPRGLRGRHGLPVLLPDRHRPRGRGHVVRAVERHRFPVLHCASGGASVGVCVQLGAGRYVCGPEVGPDSEMLRGGCEGQPVQVDSCAAVARRTADVRVFRPPGVPAAGAYFARPSSPQMRPDGTSAIRSKGKGSGIWERKRAG